MGGEGDRCMDARGKEKDIVVLRVGGGHMALWGDWDEYLIVWREGGRYAALQGERKGLRAVRGGGCRRMAYQGWGDRRIAM